MRIILLKSFGVVGFQYKIEDDNTVTAFDGYGRQLKENVDYKVEEQDKSRPIEIVQSNGLITYSPPE